MLKRINPEDLKEGQECYIKFIVSIEQPLHLSDMSDNTFRLSGSEPIYTLDDQPQHPDPELEMLVNVASELYATTNFGNYDTCAREAAYLIAACKQIKEGER